MKFRNVNLRKSLTASIVVLLIVCCSLPSCKDDDLTPGEILDLLPQEFYDELAANGFVFRLGENPPNVTGIYDFEPVNEYDNSGVFAVGGTALLTKIKVDNQSGSSADVFIKNWTGVGQVDESDATIIKGDGNDFTMVAQANGDVGGVSYKYDYAITGTIGSNGITNAQFAFIMIDNPGAVGVASEGTIRIFKDEDALASSTTVFRSILESKGKSMLCN